MVESEFWKPTAELFGKLIDKPKMQEKFLKKPPPKYIYEMILSTMGVTGFPKGLFTDEELNPKFFDENPQNKVEIFQKTIDITKIVLNENFEIKTTNILRGEEPDKTNYFLQAFHRAATSGKDCSKFITKYLDHKKKKMEDKKKQTDVKEEKKPEPKDDKKPVEKEPTVKKEPAANQKPTAQVEKPKVNEKPSGETSSNVSKSNTNSEGKKIALARPQTPGKKPEKINSEIKEVKEEVIKTTGKVPQGLISDKNKDEDEDKSDNIKPLQNEKAKPKVNKDDDLGDNKGVSKIKIGARIGKFADITGEDNKTNNAKITFTVADLESIKNYVQDISKNCNPIGKIIDFLGDDIDSMNKEMQAWIKESKNYKDRYDEEVKKSDETLLPLQNELLELEETIRDEHMRIKSIKSRMIKNEQIIQNLINNVISIKNDNK